MRREFEERIAVRDTGLGMSALGAMVGDMAATWATLAVLAAISVTFFVYLGTKIDALGSKIDAQGAELGSKIDAQGAELGSRIDALAARLDARLDSLAGRLDDHMGGHRHTG